MKTRPPADCPLFASRSQAKLLAVLFHEPEVWRATPELRERAGLSAGALHDELMRLLAAGLVVRDDSARPHRFQADMSSPLAAPLREIVEKSAAVPDRIRDAVSSEPGVQVAAIYGSAARGEATAASDIDLMVIGDVNFRSLVRRVRPIEREIRREINVVSYRPDEVAQRRDGGFLRDVAAQPVQNLIGDLHAHLKGAV